MPISHRQRRTIAMSASMLTPSALSTSAAPDLDEKARLPCLATGTPHPATTSAVAVEMLKVPEASPPVPTVSIVPGGASIVSALARIVRAAPVISSTLSPRTLSAIKKAPICDGVALPLMMMSNAASAWLSDSARPAATSARSGLRSLIPGALIDMFSVSCALYNSLRHRTETKGGIRVEREIGTVWRGPTVDEELHRVYNPGDTALAEMLDTKRGVWFSSSFEFPGRYTRWDMGFVDPPLMLTARGRDFTVETLNARGRILLGAVADHLANLPAADIRRTGEDRIDGEIGETETRFPEEQRSRQPSVFSVLRALGELFASPEDEHLGFYGAFGYDLVFQFEPMRLKLSRPPQQRDLVLYLPDEILMVDHMRQQQTVHRYDFEVGGISTVGLPRATPAAPYRLDPQRAAEPRSSDHAKGEYAKLVERAKESFIRGDLFEVVCAQLFAEGCADPPSTVFQRLREANPAPYGALVNLGEGEFLVSASPEMYVRVERTKDGGHRIETCPICGTIRRGADAIEDAEQIRVLLNSKKDESELTMCTDVDRNDKSRVCVAGSVKVIGRRQIEMYSRLIHTVDHVEG